MDTALGKLKPGAAAADEFPVRALFDAVTDEAVILDRDGIIIAANEAWRKFCRANGGDADSVYIGQNYLGACDCAKGASSADASVAARGVRSVLEGADRFLCEYPCDSPTEQRWFEMVAGPLDHDGQRYALVMHRNITTRKLGQLEAEAAFIEAELLSALVATSHDAILSFDLNGKITTWNPAAERLYGYTRVEAVGQSMEMLYPKGWPVRVSQYRDEIIAGKLRSFEVTRVTKDGRERLVWVSAAPIRNPQGAVVMISNIHRDITDLRLAEEAREIMAREVLHRFKNLLAVVNAIQRQTQRNAETLEEFGAVFGKRIAALSRSADLLLTGNWHAAPLEKLVVSQLDPFRDTSKASLTHAGPEVLVGASAVQVIGMALHELATNSAKYGALGNADGRIDIAWHVRRRDEAPALILKWVETGLSETAEVGKAVSGFGRVVLNSLPATMLNAAPSHEMSPQRVVWTLAIPADHFSIARTADKAV